MLLYFILQFNWTEYVETLFDGISDVEINDEFLINVNDVSYVRKVAKLLSKTNHDQLRELIM